MPSASPFQALRLILHGPAKIANPNIVLLDYRDPATFSTLWLHCLESGEVEIDELKIDLTESTKQFLLIGNDPPDGIFDTKIPDLAGINFRSHFTATSWLAAWKVKSGGKKMGSAEEGNAQRGNEARHPRIAVLDPRPAGAAAGVAQTLQAILGGRDSQGHPLVPGAAVLNAPSLDTICQWLAESNSTKISSSVPPLRCSESILQVLKSTIWNELVSNREQHHALSNVLGAFLLSIQVGKGEKHIGEPWAQDYMLALVQALGVEASLVQVKLNGNTGAQQWITPEHQREVEGIVLIDDMAALWAYFLRGAAGFVGRASFDQSTDRTLHESLEVFGRDGFAKDISALPDRLKTFFTSKKPHLSASDILGTNSKLKENFVLFLDLRLFPSDSQGRPGEAEVTFFKQLRTFGKTLLESRRKLSWAGAAERERLRRELDQWADEPAAGCSLGMAPRETLLPRLIALLDPTLPIVVFSSTHRTELIEPFRGYGNIITDFHKPVVTGLIGDWPQMVREMHVVFLAAMERAAAILRVRRLLRPFQKPALLN